MLTSIDKDTMRGKWITFRWKRPSESGKTQVWELISDSHDLLGYVEWAGRWRKYVFFPLSMTIYEETCLRDIAEFIELQTKIHRSKAKAARA